MHRYAFVIRNPFTPFQKNIPFKQIELQPMPTKRSWHIFIFPKRQHPSHEKKCKRAKIRQWHDKGFQILIELKSNFNNFILSIYIKLLCIKLPTSYLFLC